MSRKFSATWIFPLDRPPIKNGIVTVGGDGTIFEVTDTGGNLKEQERLEHHAGILVPGFVNAHCHLELSWMKDRISRKTGLVAFIGEINKIRKSASEKECLQAAQKADARMFHDGISLVGDISNSSITAGLKVKSQISYFNFVEVFGFHPSRADRAFEMAMEIWRDYSQLGLQASIVPHAPYSVSPQLFNIFNRLDVEHGSILSMHNQESVDEDLLFKSGEGSLPFHYKENLGLDISHWKPTGFSSLRSVLPWLPADRNLLLVHNTHMGEEDLKHLRESRDPEKTFLVLCPGANQYIEGSLPPFNLFREYGMNICLGTDSLASNDQLSMISEMLLLQENFQGIQLSELLTMACLNGARALGMDHRYGSITPGKKPGLVLIKGADLAEMRLTGRSVAKRLV